MCSEFPRTKCIDDKCFVVRTLRAAAPALRSAIATFQSSSLPQSFFHFIWQKSIPTQIRQLILYTSNNKGYVDGFVEELTFGEGTLRAAAPALRSSSATLRAFAASS